MIKAGDGQVLNNTYIGQGADAITVHDEPSYPQGFSSSNLIISGNSINDCGLSSVYLSPVSRSPYPAGVAYPASINIYWQALVTAGYNVGTTTPGVIADTNIQILDNMISDWHGSAIEVNNASRSPSSATPSPCRRPTRCRPSRWLLP